MHRIYQIKNAYFPNCGVKIVWGIRKKKSLAKE
jgi:hypothetical protein